MGYRRDAPSYPAIRSLENMYWPGNGKPRDGVVCLHGSEGGWAGWNDLYCALFAANGFAALARNYTQNARWLTHPDIDDVPLEGTEAALAAMREELAPYGCGVGLFGTSRGAEHALLLAQLLAEDGCANLPDAVAVHSPPDATWPAFIVSDFQNDGPWAGDDVRPAWSWRGSPMSGPDQERRSAWRDTHIPCSSHKGTADNTWGANMARRLVARMTEAGRPPEAHFFEGEGHVFRAAARNREWELMTDFFSRHLAPGG